MAQNNTANTEQDLNEILRLRREKLAALKSAGNDPYTVTKYDFDSDSETIKNNYDGFEGKTVKIAGRIMSRRIMGKALLGKKIGEEVIVEAPGGEFKLKILSISK